MSDNIHQKRFSQFLMVLMTILVLAPFGASTASAAKGDQGVDWSKYQGANGVFGYGHDKFAISQIGGYNGSVIYDQWTYRSQVASGIAQGKRMHTYIWWENVYNNQTADQVLNYFLPRVQTPKGSIVALDVEDGYQNTDVIMHAIDRIEAAGYTPMVYGYLNFLQNHVDLHRISNRVQLWLAEYPNYAVTPYPNYNYFPSFNNVGVFQFTSTYIAGGLDGDIDLSGITDSGYSKTTTTNNGKVIVKPSTNTPAINAGQTANLTPKSDINVGNSVKVNFSANRWASGEAIPSWVKGKTYTVTQVSGNKLLLNNIMSWISKSDAEIVSTTSQPVASNASTYVVRPGDNLSTIAARNNTTSNALASLNGITNPNYIYVGQVLKLSGTSNAPVSTATYVVRFGDNLSTIAARNNTTSNALASLNGITNPNYIYVGQVLKLSGRSNASRSYTVRYGDSLWLIGQRLGVSVSHLQSVNGISSLIYPGQVLTY